MRCARLSRRCASVWPDLPSLARGPQCARNGPENAGDALIHIRLVAAEERPRGARRNRRWTRMVFFQVSRQEGSHTPSAISYDVPRSVPSNLVHHVQKSADALYKTRALASFSLSEFAPPSLALRPLLTLVIPPSDILNIPVVSRYRS